MHNVTVQIFIHCLTPHVPCKTNISEKICRENAGGVRIEDKSGTIKVSDVNADTHSPNLKNDTSGGRLQKHYDSSDVRFFEFLRDGQ